MLYVGLKITKESGIRSVVARFSRDAIAPLGLLFPPVRIPYIITKQKLYSNHKGFK